MKFLIIQTAFIGDVVLATPLVEKLRQYYPDAQIDFLLRKGNEGLLHGHPHLRQVYVFDKKKSKWRNLIRLITAIRKEKYDHVINVQRFFTSGLLTVCSGAGQTTGFDKNPLSFLFSRRVKHVISPSGTGRHEVERNLDLITHITGTAFVRPKLYPSEADFRKVAKEGKYICIAPASVWFTKQWPAAKWIELIDRMPPDVNVYLIGAPGDRLLCEQIREKTSHPSVHIFAGQLSFLESAALMQGALMNFVNDSAPLHFASAVNAPVTAVYCSTVPAYGFGPLSEVSFIAETTEKLACRPCGLHGRKACPEGHFRCAEVDCG